jgi:hypothetical protein
MMDRQNNQQMIELVHKLTARAIALYPTLTKFELDKICADIDSSDDKPREKYKGSIPNDNILPTHIKRYKLKQN